MSIKYVIIGLMIILLKLPQFFVMDWVLEKPIINCDCCKSNKFIVNDQITIIKYGMLICN